MKEEGYFNDVILLWASRYDYDHGWRLYPHSHKDFYQIIYCITGSGIALVSDSEHKDIREHHIHEASCLFIQPGMLHSIDSIGKDGLKTLDVKFIINSKSLSDRVKNIPSAVHGCDSRIRDLLEYIRVEGETQDCEYLAFSQLYLGMVLLELIRMGEPAPNIAIKNINLFYQENLSKISTKVLAYIQNNYRRNLHASDMEEALHYSYRYLSEITTAETGYTPVELLDWVRCHIAKEKLILTDMSLKEISDEAGYPNIHQFSRSFRRLVGKPPATYRKEFLSGIRKDINFKTEFVNENHTLR